METFSIHTQDSAPGYQEQPIESSPSSIYPLKHCWRLLKLSLQCLDFPPRRPLILLYHPIQPCRKLKGSVLLTAPTFQINPLPVVNLPNIKIPRNELR